MHMYINFNTLLKAGSLMISFFLMDPLDLLPSVRLKPWEKRESRKPVAQLDDFTWFWLSGGSLAWPCSSGRDLLNPSGCAVKNSEGVEVCGHSSSPFSQSVQGPKLGRGSLTGFPMNSFPEAWAVSPMNPNFFSSSKSITQLKRRQSLRGCRSTSFPFGSCPFWSLRAREWAAWPAMTALIKAIGRATLPSCGREVSTRVLTKRRNSSQHSLAFRDLVPYAYLRARQRPRSELRVAHQHLFFGIAYFLPLNIRAVLKTGTKKFDPAAAFATQTNPKLSLVPGYSHFDKRHFHLRRETTPEHHRHPEGGRNWAWRRLGLCHWRGGTVSWSEFIRSVFYRHNSRSPFMARGIWTRTCG